MLAKQGGGRRAWCANLEKRYQRLMDRHRQIGAFFTHSSRRTAGR
jgi:hypothetical protein